MVRVEELERDNESARMEKLFRRDTITLGENEYPHGHR